MANHHPVPVPVMGHTDTTSSPAPSRVSTSQDPALRLVFTNHSLSQSTISRQSHKRGSLRSLNILGKIPKDLSSLLHTGSLSRHRGQIFQTTAKLGLSGYADSSESSSTPESRQSFDMFSTSTNNPEERPARKLKKENKFYNFLTRSRSRSRSKPDHPTSNDDPLPQLPRNGHTIDHSDSKPPYRIPSRPLSATTTATNATITPGTPKAKRNLQSAIPVPVARPGNTTNDAGVPTLPIPIQSTNTRRKLNLFGISLSGSRKPSLSSSKSRSRSRSRPGTPRVSLDIPPLPMFEEFAGPRNMQGPQSTSRPGSPSPPNAKLENNLLVLCPLADHAKTRQEKDPPLTTNDVPVSSSKLRGFFSGRDSSRSRRQTSAAVPAPSQVSAPLKRVSSIQRRSVQSGLDQFASSPDPRPSSTLSNIPSIVQTPSTPVRSATTSAIPAPKHSGHTTKNRSLDTGYRYRGTMDAVDEEGRLSRELGGQPNTKGKEKGAEAPGPRIGLTKMSTSVRNTKHGSFDFERPGWGAVAIQRTGSNGTSNTATSGWSRHGEGEVIRESTLGPGLAGVGTIQREASMKRAKEREEKARELESQAKKMVEEKQGPPKSNRSPAPSGNGHQTPPGPGTMSGKSSSMSKASGKRLFGSKGGSATRGGILAHHGLFAFEPPVPSPTLSTTSTATSKELSASWGGQSEREKERAQKERERQRDRRSIQRRDRSPVPVPIPNAGHRSGLKGRSLDLNLGLAWAPSKVREDALLPSSTFFHRSISNSSSAKSTSGSRSGNSSSHGHDAARSRTGGLTTDEERSKVGRETAELFRKALGEGRYSRFKIYVHQFDAREIPFDGPTGIISKVDGLLATVPALGFEEKRQLMDKLVRIILQNA